MVGGRGYGIGNRYIPESKQHSHFNVTHTLLGVWCPLTGSG